MQLGNLWAYTLPIAVILPFLVVMIDRFESRWKLAQAAIGLSATLAFILWMLIVTHKVMPWPMSWLSQGVLNVSMLVLISFIAFIVLCYAKTNFEADADNRRFLRWFMLTVFAVMVTVSTNHLIVFWLAWLGISLSMHQLLMFYPDRYRATLAAHKKFIFARLAELFLAAAFFLLYSHHQTLVISDILKAYPTSSLSWQEQLAALLLALAALIKCAQLPLHGWLIQVVESPTPVSALMHAGVINMGGFLLLLFAPLFSQVEIAQWVVLMVAGLTTIIAALVMMTRISIKVRLAWSTMAQMGLMLVECGLGLYDLAFLHLIAHSCYKAYAFLNSGSAVDDAIQKHVVMITKPKTSSWLISIVFTLSLLTGLHLVVGLSLPLSPWLLIGFAMAFALATRLNRVNSLSFVKSLIHCAGFLASYYLLKAGIGALLPTIGHKYSAMADLWISTLFLALLALYLLLQYRPNQIYTRKLFIALNAGFYLDEWATRITLKIWGIKLPKNAVQTRLSLLKVKK
ncbi:MAG: NADH-quinone oxidoreductase subunit L [Methylotenera sp.]|nr:NADH-quinone oxidoreductase subunit L [Methylotenera sp.]